MRNVNTGINPNTGREFLLLNVSKDKVLTYSGTSYQTRYGADQNKKSNQIIIRRDLLNDKKRKWMQDAKSASDRIYYLESKLSEYNKNPDLVTLAESTKDEISRLKRLKAYDFNSLKV